MYWLGKVLKFIKHKVGSKIIVTVISGPSTVQQLCTVLRTEKSEVPALWIDKCVTVEECISTRKVLYLKFGVNKPVV